MGLIYLYLFRLLHTYFVHCDLIRNVDVAPQKPRQKLLLLNTRGHTTALHREQQTQLWDMWTFSRDTTSYG